MTAATLTLTDDDVASTGIALTLNPASVSEGAGGTAVTVTAALDESARTGDTEVTVSVAGTTATEGTDFAAVTGVALTIAAGAPSGEATFTLTPTQDEIAEGDETLTVSGTVSTLPDLAVTAATLTLTDDDGPPTGVTLAVQPGSVAEDGGAATVEVTATVAGGARAEAVEVTVAVAGSGAAGAVDFAAVADFALTIAAASQTGTASFTVTPENDAIDESDETLTVSGTVSTVPDLAVTAATLTLTDDDERGVTVHPTELTLRAGERKTYSLRLNTEPTATARVEVIVPVDIDLTVAPTMLTFTRENWRTSQMVEVTASGDSGAPAHGITLDLTHAVTGGDYDEMPAEPVAVSIIDDPPTPDPPTPDPPTPDPPTPAGDRMPAPGRARRPTDADHRGGRGGGGRGPARELHRDPLRRHHGAADRNRGGDRARQLHRRRTADSGEVRGRRAHGVTARGDRRRHHRRARRCGDGDACRRRRLRCGRSRERHRHGQRQRRCAGSHHRRRARGGERRDDGVHRAAGGGQRPSGDGDVCHRGRNGDGG